MKRPIKILYCVESMELAGAEQVVLSLLSQLDRERFQPIVCCLTEKGKLAPKLEEMGIPVIALRKSSKFDLTFIPKMIKVIKQNQIDIVHTHCWPSNAWGRVAAWLARVPFIIATEHNVYEWKNKGHLILDRWLSKISTQVVCVSEAVKKFCQDRAGIESKKLFRIYNGIDLAPFQRSFDAGKKRKELGVSTDQRVIIVVGRLLPQKGHRYFLEALAEICKTVPSALGLIVGGGPLRQELEDLSGKLQLQSHVKFLGERIDIPELLNVSDLFVLPSIYEGLPLVVLEAMAARKPVVVTQAGGNGEVVVDGVTGLVVPIGDVNVLTAKILKLLSDPKLADKMGQAGRERMERYFSLDAMVQAHENLYDEVLAK